MTVVIHKQENKGMGHPTDAQHKVSATMMEAFVILFCHAIIRSSLPTRNRMAIVAQTSSKIEFVNLEKACPSSAAHSNIVHLARGAYRFIGLKWMELSVSWHKTAPRHCVPYCVQC